jgi:putative heme-binding domain-containing protein
VGGNLLSNAVYWHELEERGSTLAARHGGELIEARDRWFRPVDLLTGPDGCIYVVDWYDRRASHLDPRDNWDKTNGRIYRVVSGRRKAIGQFDMSTWSTEDLVSMVDQENDWWPDLARRVLWERRDTAAAPGLWARLAGERDEALAMRLVWALDACGGLDRAQAIRLFDHPVAGVRAWAVRRVGDRDFEWWDDALGQRLARLAVEDESAHVRSQLASSCQRWGFSRARAVIGGLTRRDEDMDDPFIPLQIWWAIERAFSDGVEGEGRALVEMLRQTDVSGRPLVRAHLLERAARALASEERAGSLELVLALVEGCPNPEAAEAAMRGVDLGLTGRVVGPLPAAERERWARLWSNGGEPSDAMVRVAVRLGDDAMYERAIERASRASEPEADRLALVELLGQVRRPDGRKALVTILETEPNGALRQAVISALGAYAEGVVYERMLAVYPSLDSAGRERVRGLLSSRREAAARLLEALEGGSIDPKELGLAQVQQLVALGDGALKARLENVWGRVPGTNSEERRQRIAEVRGVLPEGDKGSAARGREVFQKACAGCHRMFGEGGALGPDLSGAERGDLDFLLTSLVDPSALIRGEYEGRTVALKDGRVLTGLVVEENGASLTLVDSQQQKTTIGRGEVEEMGAAPLSIMPDGLLDTMKDEEIRDLFRFLQSENPGGR